MNNWSKYRRVAAILLLLITFFFIGRTLHHTWGEVPFHELEFNVGFLVLSYGFQFSFFILGALGWVLVMKRLGVRLPLRRAIQMTSVANLGRYIPGKIWAFVGLVYLAKRDEIPAHKTVVSLVVRTILLILSALLVFLVSLIFLVGEELPAYTYLSLLLIPFCFITLHPRVMSWAVNWGLRRLRKDPIAFDFDYMAVLSVLAVYCTSWLAQGLCFFFLIRSFYPIPGTAYPALVGINSLAWTIGFLSFVVPGGLGVREGIQSLLLRFILPLPIGIIAALLYRVWAVIGMLVFFSIFARGLSRGREAQGVDTQRGHQGADLPQVEEV